LQALRGELPYLKEKLRGMNGRKLILPIAMALNSLRSTVRQRVGQVRAGMSPGFERTWITASGSRDHFGPIDYLERVLVGPSSAIEYSQVTMLLLTLLSETAGAVLDCLRGGCPAL
jgi:hypothetical protein